MFGYVRPLKAELKVREAERYRAVYCGLCHSLKERYGFFSRFLVNYDMVLPALLLDNNRPLCARRCPVSWFRKRPCLCPGPEMERLADITLCLAYHKLEDTVADAKGLKRLMARLIKRFFRKSYCRAAEAESEFDRIAGKELANLRDLEKTLKAQDALNALDDTASCFGRITAALQCLVEEESARRVWETVFFHVGRYIYLIDAWDDYSRDYNSQNFNPIRVRYTLSTPTIPQEVCQSLHETLEQSLATAAAAFELLPTTPTSPIAANILYLGMPTMMDAVATGITRNRKKRKKFEESKHGSL